ncbi:MAG TPA: amidohydrolase family protein [Solirubrobacteraceae bacterium]|nr:amidohydrolase family protein [Solirubrobacteraceae bacterium]
MEDREREPGGERAAQAPPRLLLCGGPIITMDAARPRVDALGVSGGLISAWGSEQAVAAALGEPFERVELDGAALLPGFIDAHHHYCLAALDRRAPDLHCLPGQPLAALIARLKPFVERCETPWVRAQGYDPHKLAERRAPRREELDEICPQRPLLLMAYSCHEGVLNSAGLELMGFTAASPDPPGGRLGRRRGRLTGEVIEAPFFAAEARSRDALLAHAGDAWLAECQAHGRALLRAGIVRVGDAAVPPAIDALYERAVAAGMLPVKVHRMPVGADSLIVERFAAPSGSGPRRAPIGPAKLFLDGADQCAICASPLHLIGSLTAVLRRALGGGGLAALRASARLGSGWRPDRGGHLHHGMLFHSHQQIATTITEAAAVGAQVAQHALGNEAITVAVAALEAAGAALSDLPGAPRLEHAMILDSELAARIAAVGAIAVVNPHFVFDIGDELAAMPLPGGLRALALRTLQSAGVELAGGSDYPVSSYDVLAALRAGSTRMTCSGDCFEAQEAVDVASLLRAYTAGGAHALGVFERAGSLAPGKEADLVVLSGDPLACGPEALTSLRILRTYVDGHLAYAARDAAQPGGA